MQNKTRSRRKDGAFPLEGKTVQTTSFLYELCITGELTVQTNGEQQEGVFRTDTSDKTCIYLHSPTPSPLLKYS